MILRDERIKHSNVTEDYVYGCFLARIAKEMTGSPNLTQTTVDILYIFWYYQYHVLNFNPNNIRNTRRDLDNLRNAAEMKECEYGAVVMESRERRRLLERHRACARPEEEREGGREIEDGRENADPHSRNARNVFRRYCAKLLHSVRVIPRLQQHGYSLSLPPDAAAAATAVPARRPTDTRAKTRVHAIYIASTSGGERALRRWSRLPSHTHLSSLPLFSSDFRPSCAAIDFTG